MSEIFDQRDILHFTQSFDSDLPLVSKPMVAPTKVSIYYSDVNSAFREDAKGLVVYDKDAINRQINNILSTPLGTEDFEPMFGSLLPYRIMDNITERTAWLIRNDTIEAVRRWMGNRIELDLTQSTVSILNDDVDYEGYLVDMVYSINWSRVVAQYSVALVR